MVLDAFQLVGVEEKFLLFPWTFLCGYFFEENLLLDFMFALEQKNA
jgi:hypothetical protein